MVFSLISVFVLQPLILSYNVFAVDVRFFSGNDILFYKPNEESILSNPCSSITIPKINDEAKLADAINQYIQKNTGGRTSPLYGLGSKFVEGAVKNGVNPFIGVLHSQKESSFATASNLNWFNYVFATEQAASKADMSQKVDSFNSFGRTAGDDQPKAWYPSKSGLIPVYKWSSWEDSLSGVDSFFAYYKRKWIDTEGYTTIDQVIPQYAPNSPREYIRFMYDNLPELIKLAGDSMSCGGLVDGGMDLGQAEAFMSIYRDNPSESLQYAGNTGNNDCEEGPIANCVTFSVYFINKYTNLKGFSNSAAGNGRDVADNIKSRNIGVIVDRTPEVYSIFSRESGEWGHTGIVLGIDQANDKLIIGEASCGGGIKAIRASEYKLSSWTNNNDYKFAHISGYLKNL